MVDPKRNNSTAKALYEKLIGPRSAYLERARKCAELTIPALLPPSGHSGSSDLVVPYQSVGARGVNNLASKLLLTLLPPNSPFFRLLVDDYTLAEEFDKNGRAEFEEALGDVERAVMTEIERSAFRTPAFTALKQLLVAGNVLLYMPKDKNPRAIRLDSYVTQRSPDGTVVRLIIRETVAYAALPQDIQAKLENNVEGKQYDPEDEIEVFTHFWLDNGKYYGCQEVEDHVVEGSKGHWKKDRAPFIALRWTHMDGEQYGRSHVEEYIGDLNSLEGLSQSILETSLAAAKAVILVRPNASTSVDALRKARNLDVLIGDMEDISAFQLDKRSDLQIAQAMANEINGRLAAAFLMNSSVQRDAERVTAEEIRFMAAELEDALGGSYSLLGQEFQLPLTKRVMDRMVKEGKLPKLPEGIEPSIVTGLEALGRGHDLSKYQVFSNEVAKFGPEAIDEYLNLGDYFTRFGTGLGLDMDGLVKTEEERMARQQQQQAMMQQQQQAELAKSAVGPAINAAAKTSQGE